jgi:hypothetical protein
MKLLPRRFAACAVGLCAAFAVAPATAAVAAAPGPGPLTIHALLGGGHVSPYAGQSVAGVAGVVTDVTSSEFYLQDPTQIGGTPFKQAIAVFTGKARQLRRAGAHQRRLRRPDQRPRPADRLLRDPGPVLR